jgi:hypothetical protein
MHGVGLLKMHQRLYALFILYERQQLLHLRPSLEHAECLFWPKEDL